MRSALWLCFTGAKFDVFEGPHNAGHADDSRPRYPARPHKGSAVCRLLNLAQGAAICRLRQRRHRLEPQPQTKCVCVCSKLTDDCTACVRRSFGFGAARLPCRSDFTAPRPPCATSACRRCPRHATSAICGLHRCHQSLGFTVRIAKVDPACMVEQQSAVGDDTLATVCIVGRMFRCVQTLRNTKETEVGDVPPKALNDCRYWAVLLHIRIEETVVSADGRRFQRYTALSFQQCLCWCHVTIVHAAFCVQHHWCCTTPLPQPLLLPRARR